MDRTSVMIQNSIASDDYQPNPAFRQNAAPHARMRKKMCHHSLGDGQTWVGPLVRCFSIESFDGVSKHEFAWHRVHP